MSTGGGPTRYLIADDDAVFRGRLARALRARGVEVAEAGSNDEAVDAARAFRPERAVIDLRLGEGSGLDLLGALRREHAQLESVVLTGYGSISTALEAVRRGARHYLTKPVDADDVLRAFARDAEGDAPLAAPDPASAPSLHRVEWEHIQRVLGDCGGNVSKAARALGLHRRTLQRKLATRPPLR